VLLLRSDCQAAVQWATPKTALLLSHAVSGTNQTSAPLGSSDRQSAVQYESRNFGKIEELLVLFTSDWLVV
jgi:hypothetical protein